MCSQFCGHCQPHLPGVPAGVYRPTIHHLEPQVVSRGGKELQAEVANHLTYTALVVKTVASVSCSFSLNHFQFVYFSFVCGLQSVAAYST